MSDPAIKKLLVDLFGNQLEAARKLQFADRSVRYWVQHGAPPHVERVLRNLKRKKISLRSARKQLRQQRERRPNRANASAARDSHNSSPPADHSQPRQTPRPADHNKDASAPGHPATIR